MLDWARQRNMLELDVIVPIHLTKLLLPGMLERGSGFVSTSPPSAPTSRRPPTSAIPAAKSFILNFTEALSYELRGSGVRTTALSPGIVATEFLQVSGQQAARYQRMTMMDSPTVARLGVDACSRAAPAWDRAG